MFRSSALFDASLIRLRRFLSPFPLHARFCLPIAVLFLFSVCVLLSGCPKNPTEPPSPPPPPSAPDTTSHDFVWEIDTLGDGEASVLFDVAIINDTTVWGVGTVFLKDNSGLIDPTAYNASQWDGREWDLKRVPLKDFNSPTFGYYPIAAIQAFGVNDIWVGGAGQLAHFDGSQWGRWTLLFDRLDDSTFSSINRIWGTTGNRLYAVGNQGSLTLFNGTTWARLGSRMTIDLADISGSTSGNPAWTVAWGQGTPTALIKIKDATIEKVYDDLDHQFVARYDSLSGRLTSVAVFGSDLFVLSPTGLYKTTFDTRGEAQRLSFSDTYFPGFPTRVRGNGPNDLFIVGQRALIAHFNGSTWRWFNQFYDESVFLNSCAVSKDLVVAVGTLYISPILSRAIVYIGRR